MKTLFRLLLVLWLLLLSMTQSNMIDATIYTTLTVRGLVTDVNNLQIDVLNKQQKGLPLQEQ